MLRIITSSLVMALGWMALTGQLSVQGFVVGYIFGFAILWLIWPHSGPLNHLSRLPSQVFYTIIYAAVLAYDILLSGVDVAKRVLPPTMHINPGIKVISTQDDSAHPLISALSAHSITITPGEMVIDFEAGDETRMYVHVLDVDASFPALESDQTARLKRIKKVMGYD